MIPKLSHWHSLKTRATVFTLVIFVLGISALSILVSRNLQADMEQLLGEQQFSVVTSVAKNINDDLTERLQALQTVAMADAALLARPAALQARLEQRPLMQLLFNGGVWVAGLDGTAIADVPLAAQRIGVNYLDRDFIANVLKEGKPIIGRPIMGKKLQSPIFSIAVPVRDSRGQVAGVLVGVTDLGKPNFLDKIAQSAYGKSGGYVLISAQSRLVITATDRGRIMEPLPAEGVNAWVDRFANGYEGWAVSPNPKGVNVLVSGKGIPAAGWYVLASLPTTEAFAPLQHRQQRLVWATLLLTTLTGALTWWVLRRQLAPLVATADAMTMLANSEQMPQPLPDTQQGEIGQLVAGFNRILKQNVARESALAASKSFNETVLDSLDAEIAVVDRNGVIQAVNARWQQFALENSPQPGREAIRIGVGASYIAACEGSSDANAENTSEVRAGLQSVLDGHSPRFSHEYRCDSPQRQRWFSMVIMPLGRGGAVVSHTDITPRKQAEAALIASEERWKFAIEGAGDGLWDWDIHTGKAFYSVRYKTMLGFAEDEIGDTADEWSKRIHPEDAPGVYAGLQPYIEGKPGSAAVEFRMLCKDGHWMWTLGRGMVVQRDANGKATRMIGTNSDITERRRVEKDRSEQNQFLQNILATALDGYWLVDMQGKLLDVNNAACSMLGYTQQEALCLKVSDIDVEDSQQVIDSRIRHMQVHGGDLFESRHRRKDGSIINVEVSIRYLALKSAFSVFIRDITQRKLAEAKLHLAASVFGHAREGITITDAHGTIIDINETFTRITGYSREDAVGRNPRILSSGRQDKAFYKAMWNALIVQGHWAGEIWNRHKNGELYAALLTISVVHDEQGNTQQYVALFSDITGIKEHQRQLEHIAHFDALTNLPNRLLLADRLQQAMMQAQRRGNQVAVAYLDLDGFKNVNDRHGHDVGDKLLIHLASAMKDTLREGDTLARLGGDEFVAVLIDLDGIESCVPMLTRLLEAAAMPAQIGDFVLTGSASIGVTFYPQAFDIEADQLLRQADQAMYQAKLSGKNRFHVFDSAHDSSLRVHHESLERIRIALENREFVLHYQPKVNMQSGMVIGVEALIRWQHPEKELLAPAKFLPVIEDHPLAVELGEWVIDTALTQIEDWHATGLDLAVSVNIGARQLQQGDFVQRLLAILAKHPQVNPSSLELEVLETSALADMAQVSKVIETCHQMGVRFALDDFGTGYSSLTYLKRLRVAVLKIDQSFVHDMLDDPDDLAILEGVIGLAAAFKREVVAEGVETVEHGAALLRLGCGLAQGYGIARPMPADQLPSWVASWKPDATWSELPWLGVNPLLMDE